MDLEYQDIDPIDPLDLRSQIQEKTYFSDSDTWGSWPNSPKFLTSAGIESSMDEVLSQLHKPALSTTQSNRPPVTKAPSSPGQKKRGRKPKCPNDPVKKKIEEKDKFWLRMFRNYMRTKYPEISNSLNEEEKGFWQEYLSAKGVPDRNNIFSSYGKKYKDYLFGKPSYFFFFHEWFYEHGEAELGKKCTRGSDLWTVFYEHCSKELINYIPSGCEFLDGLSGVKGFGPFLVPLRKNFDDLLLMNGDDIIEFFMN